MNRAYIAGVGQTRFGRFPDRSCEDLACDAVLDALADAGIGWPDVQQFYAAHVGQGAAAGQRVLRQIGPSGIPVLNVENCGAAGATAVREAALAVRAGEVDEVCVAGFEKMRHDEFTNLHPRDGFDTLLGSAVPAARFALMAMEHMQAHGTTAEQFAAVAVKARRHAQHNPRAQLRRPVTIEEVLASGMVCDPLTEMQCAPTSDGAAAVVVCSDSYLRRRGFQRAVALVASGLVSDIDEQAHNVPDLEMVGRNVRALYERAGVGPEDLDVVEVHDGVTVAELLCYEQLGLCPVGEAGRLIADGTTALGGRVPVNPSGGLLAQGHPLGATGLGQLVEVVTQLRGEAGPRQVDGARLGLTCNTGLWSNCIHVLAA